jgi:hypothetical protein
MNIVYIKYGNPEGTAISITTDGGTTIYAPYPCGTWHAADIQKYLDNGGVIEPWKTPEELLVDKKTAKFAELDGLYDNATQAGFQSSALGTPHFYPSNLEAQLDLVGTVVRGKPGPFACMDQNGVKAPRNHTYPQLQKVLDDGAAYKLSLYTNLATKKAQVEAASSIEEVDNINW